MERFEGNRRLAVLFGVTGVFLVACAMVVAIGVVPRFASLTGATAALVVYTVGALYGSGLFMLYAAREASASFVVDDEGITRRAWGHLTTLAWRDIVREREFHPTGSKGKAGMGWRCIL